MHVECSIQNVSLDNRLQKRETCQVANDDASCSDRSSDDVIICADDRQRLSGRRLNTIKSSRSLLRTASLPRLVFVSLPAAFHGDSLSDLYERWSCLRDYIPFQDAIVKSEGCQFRRMQKTTKIKPNWLTQKRPLDYRKTHVNLIMPIYVSTEAENWMKICPVLPRYADFCRLVQKGRDVSVLTN